MGIEDLSESWFVTFAEHCEELFIGECLDCCELQLEEMPLTWIDIDAMNLMVKRISPARVN